MKSTDWSLLVLYLTTAGGYGGWRGPALWTGWGVWCLLLPAIAWALQNLIGVSRRNPYWGTIRIFLPMALVGVACLGAAVLALAWVTAEATGRWSSEPAIRAIIGAGLGAITGVLALLYAQSRKGAESRAATEPDSDALT